MATGNETTTPLLAEPVVDVPTAGTSSVDKTERVSCGQWMRLRAKALKKESTAIFYALQDARTPWCAKILPFLALSYYLCPLDLIPDFIPILGSIDDYIIVPSLLWLSLFLIPRDIMADARKKAKDQPLNMSKNWGAAVVVFSIWMTALEVSLYMMAHHFFWGVAAVRKWLVFGMLLVLAAATSVFLSWAMLQTSKERAQREAAHQPDVESPLPGTTVTLVELSP